MEWFYFLVPLGDKLSEQRSNLPFAAWNVWKEYFVNNGGFTKAFLIGTLISVVFILLYYFLVGFCIRKWAKTSVWIGGLVVTMLLSFVITKSTVGYSPWSGLGKALEVRYKKITDKTEEHKALYLNAKKELQKEAKRVIPRLKPIRNLCLTNFVWSGLIYFLLSIVMVAILPVSNYCKIIPFALNSNRRN